MRFVNFAFVKLSFFLILGIAASRYFTIPLITYFLPVSTAALCLLWFITRRTIFQDIYFGSVAFLCIFSIGYLDYEYRLPRHHTNHFLNLTDGDSPEIIRLRVSEVLKSDKFYQKYLAEIDQIDNCPAKGRVLLLLEKDSVRKDLTIDERLVVKASVTSIPLPLNPHQFNYSAYLNTLDVYGQIKIPKGLSLLRRPEKVSLRGKAEKIRNYLIDKLEETSMGQKERSVIQALILGQRRDIERELYQAYADAGAIHILAVSGLHVGILLIILKLFFRPLRFNFKFRKLEYLLVILSLWAFAFITGLSPSVTRAVTMFSFFAIAGILSRPTNAINTLFLSLFFLLIYNPKWLFHVGFQLSYIAVFFILWFQPLIQRLYTPKSYFSIQLWNILSVTLAAQIGIAPLGLFYFHQFSGVFFISNLILLPFLGFILGLGLLLVILAATNILPEWYVCFMSKLIAQQNDFITFMSGQEAFIYKGIHFSEYWFIASYLLILAVMLLWGRYSTRNLVVSLCSIAIALGLVLFNSYKTKESQLIIFHKNRSSIIGIKEGSSMKVLTDDQTGKVGESYPISAYRTSTNVKTYEEFPMKNVLRYKGKTLLIIDSTAVYIKAQEIDYVLLSGSPKIHLTRLIDSLRPIVIIADGSNFSSYVKRWRNTCQLKKLHFHHTGDRGAFIIE